MAFVSLNLPTIAPQRCYSGIHSSRPRRSVIPARAIPRSVAVTPSGGIAALKTAAELERAVADAPVVVLKLHARACRACIGVAPRFRKLARAYAGRALFVEMECDGQLELAAELGVDQLPFFAVWRAGRLVTAEAIGFSRIARLSERVADAV